MKDIVKKRLTSLNTVSMEVPPTVTGVRAFVAVFPIRSSAFSSEGWWTHEFHGSVDFSEPTAFRVRRFEIPIIFIENSYDIHEEDMLNKDDKIVFGIPELESLMNEWHLSADDLEDPTCNDCPI